MPDAFVDPTVADPQDNVSGIVGYEVNFNKYFYKHTTLRNPEDIAADIKILEIETTKLMKELFE